MLKKFTATEKISLNNLIDNNMPGLKSGALRAIYKNKDIKVNGVRTNKSFTLNAGDIVEVYYGQNDCLEVDIDIAYEDENIIVADKQQGINSEAVFNILSQRGECYFLHRLDRNTCGLMLFAKNKTAEKQLLQAFKDNNVIKLYHALVNGIPVQKQRILDAYLKKDAAGSKVYIYDEPKQGAVDIRTKYRVIKEFDNESLLEVGLISGKTHQIRAHLAHIGHFVIGDGKYGLDEVNRRHGKNKQCLMAKSLSFKKLKGKLEYLNGKKFESQKEL